VIAVFTYLLTGDVLRSITILVAVCPCALVLATPTAVVAAIGNAARKGMLIKNGGVMEEIGKVDVVAFDKTGTLTLGKPKVHQIIPLNGFDPDILLQLAASAERYSEHPIGRSMVAESERRSLSLYDPEDFHVLPGFGISARVQDDLVVIGNQTHLREKNVDWPEEIAIQIDQLEANGQTVVAVAANGRLAGLITLVDAPRENLRQVIQDLKDLGIRQVTMITGDHERAAERVAGLLGIDHFHSRVLPEDKLHIVKEMQAGGYKVAYVGDGINDAPALAAADIGIAMGISGTDVALETADIGLMTDEIDRLPQVIDLSRKTIRVIRQNVIFSMGVNIVAVILAGFGIISPVIGAIVHEVSALPVLANSARLVDHRLPQASPGRSVFKTSSDKVVQH
jgi:Cd2+/Zn2+-exporting ATPase